MTILFHLLILNAFNLILCYMRSALTVSGYYHLFLCVDDVDHGDIPRLAHVLDRRTLPLPYWCLH